MLGWECRAKLLKQVPPKPVDKRGIGEVATPAPNEYESPKIFCGPGYDKIKRAPAYTFGHLTKIITSKPAATPNAPVVNVQGLGKRGRFRITHSVVTPHIEPVTDQSKTPGPAAYRPAPYIRHRRPPAYSMRRVAKPAFEPWDMWTCPPNMYHPPYPGKKEPSYTLGYTARELTQAEMPGPASHDPNFGYVKNKTPAYSFGYPFRRMKPATKVPAPNNYCEKKYMVTKRSVPAPSFGIRHSPYIGHQEVYLKSSKLDLAMKTYS